ncbi:GIY-YIG nuclease family protein [Amycolatopsis sp. NPDC003865]
MAKTVKPWSFGFVYVLRNPRDPGVVKIGFTDRLAEDRAKELSGSGLPEPFTVEFRAATCRPRELERFAHDALAEFRLNPRREFFEVPVEVAIETIREGLTLVDGIDAWASDEVHTVGAGDRMTLATKAGEIFVVLAMLDPLLSRPFHPHDFWQAHADGDSLELMGTDNVGAVAGLSDDDQGATEDPVPFLDRAGTAPAGVINGRERLRPGDRLLWLAVDPTGENAVTAMFEMIDHCQVVSRTWDLKFAPNGFPLLLNIPMFEKLPPVAVRRTRAALAMPPLRPPAPRLLDSEDEVPVAGDPQPPEYWLPQLKRGERGGS